MPTEITQNNNKIEIAQSNPIITVTDNNKGTSVDVTQVDITTVTVATPGPKGDRGPSGVVGDLDTLNIIGTINSLILSKKYRLDFLYLKLMNKHLDFCSF